MLYIADNDLDSCSKETPNPRVIMMMINDVPTALLHDQLGFNSFMQMIMIMPFD
jgi:hypothetical protein